MRAALSTATNGDDNEWLACAKTFAQVVEHFARHAHYESAIQEAVALQERQRLIAHVGADAVDDADTATALGPFDGFGQR